MPWSRAYPTLPPGSQAESLRPAAGHAAISGMNRKPRLRIELSPSEDEPSRATDRARRREEIYRLADYGFAAAEIARRVGSPVGEVELILSLRDSGRKAAGVESSPDDT